jgi:D-alanine-D-alanine ligase
MWVIGAYRQPALVEGYLPGREFTVGVIGNALFPGERRWNDWYDERGFHLFPVLEVDANVGVGRGVYNTVAKSIVPGEDGAPLYLCPADIPVDLESEIKRLTVEAFEAVTALDVGRVDFRLGSDKAPRILEINTLPGMNPAVSDLCIMARAEGMLYADLIAEILHLAWNRYMRDERMARRYSTRVAVGRTAAAGIPA